MVGGGEAIFVSPLKYISTIKRRGRPRMTRGEEWNCESFRAQALRGIAKIAAQVGAKNAFVHTVSIGLSFPRCFPAVHALFARP